jgi:pSer/pThr/pTyr-binding forkhead associated (FHA) protein
MATQKKNLDKQDGNQGAYLVINNQVFPLSKKVTAIGRNLENDLVIQDYLVSRSHAEIRLEKDKYYLYDLDSTGGTFLNQKKISKSLLYSGDIILLSSVPVMFVENTTSLGVPTEEKTKTLS